LKSRKEISLIFIFRDFFQLGKSSNIILILNILLLILLHQIYCVSLKKILGPTKTLDSSESKNILGKTSGSNKNFGTLTCGKPKVRATKHSKSSFKTKPDKVSSSAYFTRSSSGTRNPTFLRLVNGEQPLYFIPVVLAFIILLLVYLLLLKLLHLPFDRGKETFIFIY